MGNLSIDMLQKQLTYMLEHKYKYSAAETDPAAIKWVTRG